MADDLPGGAPAPAENTAAPAVESASPQPPAAVPSAREALDRAFDAVDAQEERGDQSAAVDKPAAGERSRNPDGTFKAVESVAEPVKAPEGQKPAEAAKAPSPAGPTDAPSRFSPDAKAAWAGVPDPVKAEVNRAIRELEQGHEKYKADATAFETFRPFVDLAKRSNIDPSGQLANYVAIDQLLAKDFTAGMARICENLGVSLKDFAAHVLGQPADRQASAQDGIIRELRGEITKLQQGFGGVQQTLQTQQQSAITQHIASFRSSLPEADQALFDEMDGPIGGLIKQQGLTLADAFAQAKEAEKQRVTRLAGNFGLTAQPQVVTPASDPAAQTRKGQLSVSGAPGSGSNPAARKPPSSPREALDRAFASAGL